MRRWQNPTLLIFITLVGCSTTPPKPDPFGYHQLTTDSGETTSPSLSADGRFVAYASDRSGNLDIWVQALDTGISVRVTDDPARDYDPVFSADSKTIYFASLREPQGIYRVAASGGESEMIARGAVSPEVSPDGKTLLFSDAGGNPAIMDIAAHTSQPLLENFANGYAPKWSPNGQEILFTGKAAKDDPIEWWVTSATGATPVNTGLLASLKQLGFAEAMMQAWLPADQIVFTAKQGDKLTLWRCQVSPDRKNLATQPVRVTDQDSGDFRASYRNGHLVFERSKGTMNFWSFPVDINQARATGDPQRLTSSDSRKGSASISADGKRLLYSEDQAGTFRFVFKDLATGKEETIGPSTNTFYGVLSADGSRYMFGAGPPGAIDASYRGVHGWRSWWTHSICDRCGMPRGVSRDGKSLLTWTDTDPNHIDLVALDSGKPRPILESLSDHFYGPELSPDGNWISFVTKSGKHAFRTYIARVPAQGTIAQHEWIPVTKTSDEFQMAFWSPDASILYLLNEHGEGNLTWLEAQRLDPSSKNPSGEPALVYHFKSPRVPSMDPVWNHPAAVQGRILLQLVDLNTNVWIMNAN